MRKPLLFAVALLWLAVAAMAPRQLSRQLLPTANAQAAPGQAQPRPPEPLKLKVGDAAPDFTLLAFDGHNITPISLHDFKGKKNVALAFYVFAFTGG